MLNFAKVKYQKGVSLVEILVTTLILGIGLLGVAALQISGISSNLEGFYTSQATSLAEELATRMRSSKVVTMIPTSNGRTNIPYGDYLANYLLDADPVVCPNLPTNCRSNGAVPAVCDMQTLATFDLQDICWTAEQTLPDPEVRVVNDGNRMSIVIDWASTSARKDLGEISNVNASCAVITGNADRNCILMELVP
ncbi:MAG: type IV pilus modification protein PilV [Gammaproteobacteria bacterium]|nr:MAG: type IV pilus modification protein PilV [Gammaproteobacteria bacterium]